MKVYEKLFSVQQTLKALKEGKEIPFVTLVTKTSMTIK